MAARVVIELFWGTLKNLWWKDREQKDYCVLLIVPYGLAPPPNKAAGHDIFFIMSQ